jgi:hypothetical protein
MKRQPLRLRCFYTLIRVLIVLRVLSDEGLQELREWSGERTGYAHDNGLLLG